MQIHNVPQGSDAWHGIRRMHFTASEASAMMGDSTKMKRNELLSMKKLGAEKEVSAYVQKFLFDKGHEFEASARPIIEENIGEELYPVTGTSIVDGLPLLASYDGLTMMEEVIFEHKMWNEKLADSVRNADIPLEYCWQLEQQLLISGAKQAIFVVSDGTSENMESITYIPVPGRAAQLLAGWRQFKRDLEDYVPPAEVVDVVAAPIMSLPALSISIRGEVASSNLEPYKKAAIAFIGAINTNLTTDEDFVQAEANVKFCEASESELESVKKQALAQTADIEELFRVVDHVKENMRQTRLTLSKSIKSRKDAIRVELIRAGRDALRAHTIGLQKDLGMYTLPAIECDLVGAIKGKRTIESLRNAVDTTVANSKIKADQTCRVMLVNIKALNDADPAKDYMFLFRNVDSFISNEPEHFALIIAKRISDHKEAEERRAQAKRERQEKADAEAKATTDAAAGKPPPPKPQIQSSPDQKMTRRDAPQQHSSREIDSAAEEHGRIVRAQAVESLIEAGVSKTAAKTAVRVIASGVVTHITLNY